MGHVLDLARCKGVLKDVALMGRIQRVVDWISCQKYVSVGCSIEMIWIVEIVGGAESLIFVEIGCLNGLIESVSVGLENIF